MRIAFFGTPEFAVPTLDAIVAAGHDVALVVSRPDQPAGRHLQLTSPAVMTAAARLGLPTAQPEKLGTDDFVGRLRALAVEIAVVVAFGRLISPRVLRVPRLGFVNLHPSLLPRHRGPSPIAWAIASGDRVTGVSTMLLDEGMDTGPVLLQRPTPIAPRERTPMLELRLAVMGAELVVETLAGIERRAIVPQKQDDAAATLTPKLDRKHGRIDWNLPAAEIERRCLAFDPWPGLFCNFRGTRVKVHDLRVGEVAAAEVEAGTIVGVAAAGISVRCGDGTVALLTELQREGRRRLPADAFILGERVALGERFR